MFRKATFALAFVALFAAGCGSEVTYKYPTDQYPLAQPGDPVNPDDYKIATAFESKFEQAAKAQKGILVSPVMAWQTANLFLTGSSGDTYDKTADAMGVKLSHDTSLAPTTKFVRDTRKAGYKISQGLFFVWPIVPSKEFQGNIAVTLGMDVVKLGSAGQGASQSLTSWIRKRAQTHQVVQLSRDDMFVDYAVLDVPGNAPGMTWQNEDGAPYKGPFKNVDLCADIKPILAGLKFPFASAEKVHLDLLAQELQDESVKGQFRQVITCRAPDTKGGWYRLVDSNGQILLCGNG